MQTGGRFSYALTVEGFGNDKGLYRITMIGREGWVDIGTLDPDGLYLDSSDGSLLSFPSSLSSSIDVLTGDFRSGTDQYRILGGKLFNENFWTYADNILGTLTSDMTYGDTSLTTNATLSVGQVIHIEREAMVVSSDLGGGTYGVTRAALESKQSVHVAGLQIYPRVSALSLAGRIVKVYKIPLGATSYSQEVQQDALVLGNVTSPDNGVTTVLPCTDLMQLVRGTYLMEQQWKAVVGQDGRVLEYAPDAGYGGQDRRTRRAMFLIDEKSLVVASYVPAGRYYRVDVDNAIPVAGSTVPGKLEPGQSVVELLSNHVQQPPNNNTGDPGLPLKQDPAELVLTLLLTTPRDGTPGDNNPATGDPVDTGVNNLAGDIDVSLVDVDQIREWGRVFGSIYQADNVFLGEEGKPENLYDTIKRILWPRGAVLVTFRGKFRILQLSDAQKWAGAPGNDIQEIDLTSPDTNLMGYPRAPQDRGFGDAVAQINAQFGRIPGQESVPLRLVDPRKGNVLPRGQWESQDFDANAYRDESIVEALVSGIVARGHSPIPKIRVSVLNTKFAIELGDVVRVTHPTLFPRSFANAGMRGVSGVAMLVTRVEPGISDSSAGDKIHLELSFVGVTYGQTGRIAPSAEVTGWDAGNLRIEIKTNEFTDPNAVDLPQTDAEAFFDAGFIDLLNADLSDKDTGLEIVSKGETAGQYWIQVVAAPSPVPAAGDYLVPSRYSICIPVQQLEWIYIADANNQLGGSTDSAKSYTR